MADNFNFDDFDSFDSFDDSSFGSSDGFGNSSNSPSSFDDLNFGDSFGNQNTGDNSGGFGGTSHGNSQDSFGFDNGSFEDNSGPDLDFTGQFDANSTQNEPPKSLKKTGIIAVGVGVGVIVLVLGIASIAKAAGSKNEVSTGNTNGVTVVGNNNYNVNANDIMQSGNTPPSNTTVVNPSTSSGNWTEITSSETIEFYSEYQDHVFTITNIKHYAQLTDNTLVVKTELTGSLSGMSGTYKLDIPYNKGCLLNIGNEFSVKVLKGSFNGKNVVGDIKY